MESESSFLNRFQVGDVAPPRTGVGFDWRRSPTATSASPELTNGHKRLPESPKITNDHQRHQMLPTPPVGRRDRRAPHAAPELEARPSLYATWTPPYTLHNPSWDRVLSAGRGTVEYPPLRAPSGPGEPARITHTNRQ